MHIHVGLRTDDALDEPVGADDERAPLVGDRPGSPSHAIGLGHRLIGIGQEREVELMLVGESLLLVGTNGEESFIPHEA